jgi:hypothetical protein
MSVRAYLAFGTCSMAGAICYGLLIHFFWMPALTPRPIARISLGCLIATLLAVQLERLIGVTEFWALAAVWWCAFSGGLWTFGRVFARAYEVDDATHGRRLPVQGCSLRYLGRS